MSRNGGQEVRLVLFFTHGVSLQTWSNVGNLDRELAVYRRLLEQDVEVTLVTYGGAEDRKMQDQLGSIGLIALDGPRAPWRHAFDLLRSDYRSLRGATIFKTNQIFGSDVALWCKRMLPVKLIVRCGFLHSAFVEEQTQNRSSIRRARALERRAFRGADLGVVTSQRDLERVISVHRVEAHKLRVIPNYVVTEVFRRLPDVPKRFDLACVARGAPQKNIDSLLEALAQLKARGRDVSLLLIGGATEVRSVRERVEEERLAVTLMRNVANFSLPHHLNSARAFILPSHYEGHPKALLEAMSCEMPVIATGVVGIREVLRHGATGYLCETTPASLAQAIEEVLGDPELCATLAANGRRYIEENVSLDRVVDLERALLDEVISRGE